MITKITCNLKGYGTICLRIDEGTVTARDGYYDIEILKGTIDNVTISRQNVYLPIHCTIIIRG